MVFRVIINKEEDCYIADIPSLKHCFASGDTIEEAIENLKEALEGTLENMTYRKASQMILRGFFVLLF